MIRRTSVCSLLVIALLSFVPQPASGANKEIQELQRDLAQLQDMVRAMQRSNEEKLAELRTLVQQSLSAAGDASKAAAAIQTGLQQSLRDLDSKVVAPVVGLGNRMDQVSGEVRTMQQAVADQNAAISKLQSLMTDVNNAVKSMQAPLPPPPGQGTSAAGSGGLSEANDRPSISSTELMNNANRDRMAGKFELAVGEYNDYLKYYGNTEMAPTAQYQLGWIHYSQGDYETALRDFDLVLEKYTENSRTPDAMYYKGLSLLKLNRRTDAASEFRELAGRFPKHDNYAKSCDELKRLGYACPAPRSAPSKSTSRKR